MDKKVSDLTVSELKTIVKRIVRKELREHDPDDNFVVREEISKILNKNIKDRKSGKQKTLSFSKVFAK